MRGLELTFTNEDKGYRFGEEILPFADLPNGEDTTLPDVYRLAVAEGYGRCMSKIYCDGPRGTEHVGYYFESRQEYENDPRHETYIRGVWLTVGEYHPAVREAIL